MEIDIKRIAELAALEIPDEKFAEFEKDFSEIVNMVSELPEYSEEDILPAPMELREDITEECSISREELMKNAHETVNGCFAVPRTVEQ